VAKLQQEREEKVKAREERLQDLKEFYPDDPTYELEMMLPVVEDIGVDSSYEGETDYF